MSIDVVRAVEASFAARGLLHHAGVRSLAVLPMGGGGRALIVQDLALSARALGSGAFAAFDAFGPGLDRLAAGGTPLRHLGAFWRDGPLFREGSAHLAPRRAFAARLASLRPALATAAPVIRATLRRMRPQSATAWSRALVQLCTARLLAALLGVEPRAARRALAGRRNVFHAFFHPSAQLATEATLARLHALAPADGAATDATAGLLASALVTMGMDPLMGSVCAGIATGEHDLRSRVQHWCPTSFVTRRCIAPVDLGGVQVRPGDLCFLALLPARDEPPGPGLAFGLGPHACIGRALAEDVLALAGTLLATGVADGCAPPRPGGDGAFLVFRD